MFTNRMNGFKRLIGCLALCLVGAGAPLHAVETIWIEAESLEGVRGSCFPDMDQKTAGHWALSGPGIAPEWTQGGESEWLSIACGPDENQGTATTGIDVPETGVWRLWIRYRDWRDQSEVFAVRVEQPGVAAQEFVFGDKPVVDENDEFKLYWKWAFGWAMHEVKLVKGPATLTLLARTAQPGHRQVDVLCLTTDVGYRPHYREKPWKPVWTVLDAIRTEPNVAPAPLTPRRVEDRPPAAWKIRTPGDKGFVYLWNMRGQWEQDLVSQDPRRMLMPYSIDPASLTNFRAAFGGKTDVPIFSDPRIAPAFHNAGPEILSNTAFVAWLDANPDRMWGNMMNYFPPKPLSAEAKARWPKYRDRYVGNVAGESLGYFQDDAAFDRAGMGEALKKAGSREEVFRILTGKFIAGIAAREQLIWGQPVDNPYRQTISCLSVGMTAFAHACFEWGAGTVGYESHSAAGSLAMRLAFLRGAARQYGGITATYRSSGLGDAHTLFADMGEYSSQRYVYDNWYDVWSGAGMTWYKFDIWHQYFSGAGLFYHEQGFDEFWRPAGGATPRKDIQLSPKGRLVEQFLSITRQHPDRGVPYTPLAFLLDRAHGWESTPYHYAYFERDPMLNPAVLRLDRHGRMLREWFQVAYHPYGPREAEPNTAVNQTYPAGVFGDVFDVLVTAPGRTDLIDHYPVVVLNGQIDLTEAWGNKLAGYVEHGGTLLVSADQVRGPGLAALKLPAGGPVAEDTVLQWVPGNRPVISQRYRYHPITGGDALIQSTNGAVIAATYQRGKGRMVYLSIPLGLGIDQAATPAVALLLAHARQGLMPVEVRGDVEWLLNRTGKGWIVTLLNPNGNAKPQHGIVPTDRTQERPVIITAEGISQAVEWFTAEKLVVKPEGRTATVAITVPAAGVRIVELQ